MSRYVAFLRAINVGGHVVKMETLRSLFEGLGFAEVETFIASGNVIFRTGEQNTQSIEAQISQGLEEALGYEVATFIRTETELAQIAAYEAFPRAKVEAATAYNIAFLHEPLNEHAKQTLMGLRTEIDAFATHARDVYWLCQKKQSESTFSNALLEKRLGIKSTIRGVATVQKLAARIADQRKEGYSK
jgi:uncharacterized protein (DUF1697 family)